VYTLPWACLLIFGCGLGSSFSSNHERLEQLARGSQALSGTNSSCSRDDAAEVSPHWIAVTPPPARIPPGSGGTAARVEVCIMGHQSRAVVYQAIVGNWETCCSRRLRAMEVRSDQPGLDRGKAVRADLRAYLDAET